MRDGLKQEIVEIIESINELFAKANQIVKLEDFDISKEEIEIGIHIMNIHSVLMKAKCAADRMEWCLERLNK